MAKRAQDGGIIGGNAFRGQTESLRAAFGTFFANAVIRVLFFHVDTIARVAPLSIGQRSPAIMVPLAERPIGKMPRVLEENTWGPGHTDARALRDCRGSLTWSDKILGNAGRV